MRRRRGLTLAETLLAAVILAGAALAVWAAVGAGRAQARQSDQFRWAGDVGDELIERVIALPYADPDSASTDLGPEPGEVPPGGCDNADDYHGYAETPGGLRDAAGTLLPDQYQTCTRSVSIKYETQVVPGLGGIAGLTVTVTVVGNEGARLTLTRFIRRPADED